MRASEKAVGLAVVAVVLLVLTALTAGGPDEASVARSWCETRGSLVATRATMYSQTWEQACWTLYKER